MTSTYRDDTTNYEKILEELDEKSDEIVAYRSPILASADEDEDGHTENINAIMDDGGSFSTDVKFIGWYYFHPNLDEFENSIGKNLSRLMKKIKNRIIKKASKTSNKKRGGINMMHYRFGRCI